MLEQYSQIQQKRTTKILSEKKKKRQAKNYKNHQWVFILISPWLNKMNRRRKKKIFLSLI
jgi:hypothetical protein